MPRKLIIILIGLFILSVALSFHWQFRPRVDAGAYDSIGWNIARGLGYIEREENAGQPEKDDAIVRVGPGYEYFLAGIYKVFGHNVPVVWVIQAALHVLNTFFIYRIAREVFSNEIREKVAWIATLLYAFSPDLIFMTTMTLSETLFLSLFLSAMLTTLKVFQSPKAELLVASGFLWGLTILTRPTALAALAAIGLFLWWKFSLRKAALLVGVGVLTVLPWSLAMTARYNTPILTTTAGWYDMWVGNHRDAEGGFEKTTEIQQFRDTHHSIEIGPVARQKYVEFLISEPLQFMKVQIKKTAAYFSLLRPTGNWLDLQFFPTDRLLLAGLSAMWTGGLLLLGIAGGLYFIYNGYKEFNTFLLLLIAVLQPLAVIPIIVDSRYRYALFPFLALFAAYSVYSWVSQQNRGKISKALLWSSVWIVAMTGIDFAANKADVIEKIKQVL